MKRPRLPGGVGRVKGKMASQPGVSRCVPFKACYIVVMLEYFESKYFLFFGCRSFFAPFCRILMNVLFKLVFSVWGFGDAFRRKRKSEDITVDESSKRRRQEGAPGKMGLVQSFGRALWKAFGLSNNLKDRGDPRKFESCFGLRVS